jgi:MarR family transcriptional regulator, negative regulator of the multidrug operon emrRAB
MSSDERTANLLGALALTVADRMATGSDAAALITLRNYAEGEPLDLLRRALALSHPGVVRLADRLERRGLVERHRSERDGRAVALRLTRAGRRAADDALAARAAAIDDALATLDPGERAALAGMLERMLAAATTDATASLVICRLCDPDVCGHPNRCPVTQAAREAAA